VFALAAFVPQGAPPRIVYVNSKIILDRAPGRQAAEDAFEKEMSVWRAQVQKMGDSLQAMIAAYQKARATMPDAAKEAKETEIRTRQDEYQKKVQELDQQAGQRQQELVQPILDQIRKVLDDMRAEEGYAFILDAGADGATIVAADRNLDITEKVIARLKPVPVTAAGTARPGATAAKPDSTKSPLGAKAQPAGVKPIKPPTQ
jgi:outer membrane protein